MVYRNLLSRPFTSVSVCIHEHWTSCSRYPRYPTSRQLRRAQADYLLSNKHVFVASSLGDACPVLMDKIMVRTMLSCVQFLNDIPLNGGEVSVVQCICQVNTHCTLLRLLWPFGLVKCVLKLPGSEVHVPLCSVY